jgi:phospholipid transport system substrate-binding protein
MNKRINGWYLFFLAVFVLVPINALANTPKETVEGQVNKVLEILRDPAVKSQTDEVKKDKIRPLINEVFDYRELSKRTLGRNWKKLNPDQQQKFTDLFSQLLEKVYMGRILEYTDEKVIFGTERMLPKKKAEVQSKIVTKAGTEIPLFYRMIQKDGKWKAYDVIIEGVSMVKNYRTQFRDILAKKSPDDLLDTLAKKVKSG